MRLKTRRAVDWKAACTLFLGKGGEDNEDNASDGGIHRSEQRIELGNDSAMIMIMIRRYLLFKLINRRRENEN